MVYGLAIIGIILLASDGIYWRIHDRWAARRKGGPGESALPGAPVSVSATVATAATAAAAPRAASGRRS